MLTPPAIPRRQWLTQLGALGLTTPTAWAGAPSTQTAPALTELEHAVRRAARQSVAGGVVGAVVGAITPTQQALAAAGTRRLGENTALRPADFLNFGSNGKAMTAMAIARLVEQQVLAWDTRIFDALPDLARIARPDYADVTLLQLLNHRGGLAPFTDTGTQEARFFQHLLTTPDPLPTALAGQRRYAARWLLRQAPAGRPGHYLYSNAGYMLAAAMAEARCGQPFEALIQQQLAQPLGLRIDTTRWAERPATYPQGYEGLPGALTPPDTSNALEQTWSYALAPAGFYACTATSYTQWLATLAAGLRGETTPLPAATLRRLRALAPNRYALGWDSLDLGGTMMLFHRGNAPGFMAETVLAQDGSWAVFAISNTAFTSADGSSWVFDLLDGQLATVLTRVMG
ncbi:hypothetical protein VITFI_CDS1670 [Vitreoscilla filiformis]|uniref:Beta-lactamase-related domain-containing protein n=1 Tax=Vitreoscilla filiformis TaxID=63 RepID=A0A221KEJ5_VITFI|nr:serine hydrolase domain-containing protein [Vitreoscilla filiformis]ASM77448.1 hypothetical protein VITFI_CDS1670 [Vitreoscilla filiformis]